MPWAPPGYGDNPEAAAHSTLKVSKQESFMIIMLPDEMTRRCRKRAIASMWE